MRRRITTRKKGQNRLAIGLIFIVVVMLVVTVSMRSISLRKEQEEYNQRIEKLDEQIQEQNEYTESLEELRQYMQTNEYVEEVAKEKLGLVYEDEVIFKIED